MIIIIIIKIIQLYYINESFINKIIYIEAVIIQDTCFRIANNFSGKLFIRYSCIARGQDN